MNIDGGWGNVYIKAIKCFCKALVQILKYPIMTE